MTTEPVDGQPGDENAPALRAVPGEPAELEHAESSPAVYADVTAPGERKPILPPWLRGADAMKHHARRAGGYAWHAARYHGLRSPVYLALTVFWAAAGILALVVSWVRWVLFPVPLEVYTDAIADGHRAWHRAHAVHEETTRRRLIASAVVAAVGVAAWVLLRHRLPGLVWPLLAAAAVVGLARLGRGSRRIVQPAHVPMAYEALTQDVITRALGSLGLAGINQWLREGNQIAFAGPVRQDGPGWRAEVDLPFGVTATQIIERREQLASGLRRPLGAVWPEPVTSEHAGRLELWVGREDISKAKAPAWPLLRSGAVDIFAPFPYAVDVRGRVVKAPLIYHNWLLGSIPRQGKTAAVRVLACAVALDPLAEPWVHELKGTGDLDAMEAVAHRFVSGIDDEAIGYAAESLRLLRAEIGRRAPRIKALDPRICPEKRVTREIAARRSLRLRPIACIIDEAQNLFAHPKHGKQAGDDAEFIIKVGPAMGVVLVLATQRPDKDSLPTGISSNVSIRFCLKVMGQVENDMILGTSAYRQGIRATTFRPKIDAGLGYLIGEDPAQVCRTYFLDVADAKAVVGRARAARERAGTLTGYAAGEDTSGPARDVLADALACFTDGPALHWTVLAERLAQRWPERYAGLTDAAISAQLRDAGVRSVTVSMGGAKARGCRLDAIEAITAAAVTPRSDG
jgi:S-DNA-T family DNA segregation ATPase FtsK/SpoIIIE